MNFFNLLSSGASLFNFNLLNSVGGLGLNSNLEMSTSKSLNPEQIIKEPPTASIPTPPSPKQYQPQVSLPTPKESNVQLFTKQQQLINQYMHLNLQLLSKKLQNLQQSQKVVKDGDGEVNDVKSNKKKIKKSNSCGHGDKEHYAKGMCSNCYHKFGRNKKPWNCPHDKLYANGMCQNCYINSYNRKRREERVDDRNDEMAISRYEESELKEEERQ